MCDTCTTATQHFTAGAQPSARTLQTSVQQGTSPQWDRPTGDSDDHDYR